MKGREDAIELIFDCETTTFNKGSPFDSRNSLLCVGYRLGSETGVLWFEYTLGAPIGDSVSRLQGLLERCTKAVCFNAKFELHWLKRYGIHVKVPVWDTQVYEFVASGQNPAYPSLEGSAEKHGLGKKYTEIEALWETNLDARLIPQHIITQRVESDVELTAALYAFQQEDQRKRSQQFQVLIQVEMLDLRVLEEIEWNGQKYNYNKAKELAAQAQREIDDLTIELGTLVPGAPINWNSTDHKSVVLYGGTITWGEREVVGQYKTGAKVGHDRYRVTERTVVLPRLCEPQDGTDLDKPGYWSTAEPVLRLLKAKGDAKRIIDLLLRRQVLEKLVGTYYSGIPELIDEMGWEDHIVHGSFNQCVAVTGRLSSSKPNLQNQPDANKMLFITRY